MNETSKPSQTKADVVARIIITCLLVGFLILLARGATSGGGERGFITKSIANCRQIIIAFRLYADDHDGRYPDSNVPGIADANAAFRELIVGGALEDEKIFGCPKSAARPDGDIGTAPDFMRAVEPGENHWAMTKGLSSKAAGGIPLIFENPIKATWPPFWNADIVEAPYKGRVWKIGKIIIGCNDGSVEPMKLTALAGIVTLKGLGLSEKTSLRCGSAMMARPIKCSTLRHQSNKQKLQPLHGGCNRIGKLIC